MSILRVEKIWVAQKATVDKRVNYESLRDLAVLKATVTEVFILTVDRTF